MIFKRYYKGNRVSLKYSHLPDIHCNVHCVSLSLSPFHFDQTSTHHEKADLVRNRGQASTSTQVGTEILHSATLQELHCGDHYGSLETHP